MASSIAKTRGIASATTKLTLKQGANLVSKVAAGAGDAGRVMAAMHDDDEEKAKLVESKQEREGPAEERVTRRRKKKVQTIDDELLADGERMRDEDNLDELVSEHQA